MRDIKYNLQFEKLCSTLQLGKIKGEPKVISGGLLHRMYAVETMEGKYAVKALNPKIMVRPPAMQHFINSEKIVKVAARNISALPAARFNGAFIHEVENQFYLVFPWVEGKSLKPDEINKIHCEEIGGVLANMHMTDFSELGIINDCSNNEQLIDWNYYLQKGQESNLEWANSLLEIIDKLYFWNTEGNKSEKVLGSNTVISHRDLDPKNVMWKEEKPIVIDWESAGYINPMEDLVETALYWSQNEKATIDKERFLAFIDGYKNKKQISQENWSMVLAKGFLGKLGWLEYNLKRSIGIECTDIEEKRMGTVQVIGTIKNIKGYSAMVPEIENWLNNDID